MIFLFPRTMCKALTISRGAAWREAQTLHRRKTQNAAAREPRDRERYPRRNDYTSSRGFLHQGQFYPPWLWPPSTVWRKIVNRVENLRNVQTPSINKTTSKNILKAVWGLEVLLHPSVNPLEPSLLLGQLLSLWSYTLRVMR